MQRLLQRAQTEGRADDTEDVIRRRQEIYAEETAAAHRGLPRARVLVTRSTAWARSTRSPTRIFEALGRRPRATLSADGPAATAGSRSRRRTRSTRCGAAGLVVGETLELLRASARAGMTTGELDAIAEEHIRSRGATPSFLGYATAVPRHHLHVGQRRGRARHPRRPRARRRRRRLDRLRRDRRRLARRRRDHACALGDVPDEVHRADAGHRGGAVARDRRRAASAAASPTSPTPSRPMSAARAATACSRSTSATASAPRWTSRPKCAQLRQTRPGTQARPGLGSGGRADGGAGPGGRAGPGRRVDRPSTADGSLAAHFEHTFTLTPNGAWVLTALDGGEARLAELGVPFGGS